MSKFVYILLNVVFLFELKYVDGDIGTISGYPQVDIRDLNALTLSWNQVKLIFKIIAKFNVLRLYKSWFNHKILDHMIFNKYHSIGSLSGSRKLVGN